MFVGGQFSRAGRPTGSGADLSADAGTPDFAFSSPNGYVHAVIADGAGGWFIGGELTRVGGVPRAHLAHLLAAYDLLADHTALAFESVWAARRGSAG